MRLSNTYEHTASCTSRTAKARDRAECLLQHLIKKAGPGDPAAPKTFCLPLLPSGPGGVHRVLLHRAQPLNLARPRRAGVLTFHTRHRIPGAMQFWPETG